MRGWRRQASNGRLHLLMKAFGSKFGSGGKPRIRYSVVLPDVVIGLFEEFVVRMELVFEKGPAEGFLTSRSPARVFCHPGNLTRRTISSISATTRSTKIGVSSVLISLNRSVRAALSRSSSSSSGSSFSAWMVSLAMTSNCFRNSTLLICPDSKRSFKASSRSESCLKAGLPECFRRRLASLISISLDFVGSGFESRASRRSPSRTSVSRFFSHFRGTQDHLPSLKFLVVNENVGMPHRPSRKSLPFERACRS